jgi:hypothetical protein
MTGDPPQPEGDAMRGALYRHLDQHDVPGDPPFDVEAGLRGLADRIRRELPGTLSWDCEAYGPPAGIGYALCFFAEPGERECASVAVCHSRMAAERLRVFNRIQEMAAAGDPDAVYLAGEFSSSEQLLNAAAPGQDQEQESP